MIYVSCRFMKLWIYKHFHDRATAIWVFPNKEKQKLTRSEDLSISWLFQKLQLCYGTNSNTWLIFYPLPHSFHFRWPLLIIYLLTCPRTFTLMSFNSSVQRFFMLCWFLRHSESLRVLFFEKAWIWEQPVNLQAMTFNEMQVLHFPRNSLLYPFSPLSAFLINTGSYRKKKRNLFT